MMVTDYKKVKKYINDLRSFLYKNASLKFPLVRYNGKSLKYIKSETFSELFKNVNLVFFDNLDKRGFATISNGKVYVGINIYDDVSPSSIYHSLSDKDIIDTITHELIHILDMQSHSDIEKALTNYKKSDYDNHYWERNAFFHNISKDLLDRIEFLEDRGRKTHDIIYKDIGDIHGYIKSTIGRLSGEQKQHWSNLNRTNKQRFLVRFYQLFNHYKTMLKEYKL